MGSVPTDLAVDLRKVLGLQRAIETGTYYGDGTRALAAVFSEVVSIELSPRLYELARKALADLQNVRLIRGDSRDHLPLVARDADATFYWLDGHWSAGETAGEARECPILDELAAIGSAPHPYDCVVIDDARYFASAPPRPHVPDHWPTLIEVFDAIRLRYPEHHVTLLHDLVIAVPMKARNEVDAFAARRVGQRSSTVRGWFDRAVRTLASAHRCETMVPRVLPLRTLPSRGVEFATYRLGRFGERRGVDWLTYNPLQLHAYHHLALADAPAVIGAIFEVFPDAMRFADVGAGSGAFAAEVIRRGRAAEACEYALAGRLYARLQNVSSRSLDLRRDPPAELSGQFDLSYCFEVAEHCPAPLGDRLVAFLSRTAPLVVLTAARPGQGGLGHVNEQEATYWIERFAYQRMRHRADLVKRLREAFARHSVPSLWFLENLMVFERE